MLFKSKTFVMWSNCQTNLKGESDLGVIWRWSLKWSYKVMFWQLNSTVLVLLASVSILIYILQTKTIKGFFIRYFDSHNIFYYKKYIWSIQIMHKDYHVKLRWNHVHKEAVLYGYKTSWEAFKWFMLWSTSTWA